MANKQSTLPAFKTLAGFTNLIKYGIITLLLWMFAHLQGNAQECDSFERLMQEGDALFNNETPDYRKAVDKYMEAMLDCQAKAALAKQKINLVFDQIEALKNKALAAEKNALAQKAHAERMVEVFLPAEAKTDPFSYFWKYGKLSFARFDYTQAYFQLFLANEATNLPLAMKDSVDNLFKEVECYHYRYVAAKEHFYQNEFTEARRYFAEINDRNPSDSLSLFMCYACGDYKTENMIKVEGGLFFPSAEYKTFPDEYTGELMENVTWTLTGYYMAKYETTNAQYARFLNEFSAKHKGNNEMLDSIPVFIYLADIYSDQMRCGIYDDNGVYKVVQGYENRPAAYVSWYGSCAFCRFYGLQLPSEAQWEFAARGGIRGRDAPRGAMPLS